VIRKQSWEATHLKRKESRDENLSMVLIAVLWLSLPAVGADAPAAKNAQELADEVKQATTPLGCSYFADLPDRIWADTKVRVVSREEARSMIASEYGDHFKDYKSAILTLALPSNSRLKRTGDRFTWWGLSRPSATLARPTWTGST